MAREREFNASNRRIEAEYLVNILRKFLQSTNLSERSQLSQVLCSILHFNPEETRQIAEKWSVTASQANSAGVGAGGVINRMSTPVKNLANIGSGIASWLLSNPKGDNTSGNPTGGRGIDSNYIEDRLEFN